jgi:hypothetical protein
MATARNLDGNFADPMSLIFPILHEVNPGELRIEGTGFWITVYGLFITARHVLEEVYEKGNGAYALHWPNENQEQVYLRKIEKFTFSNEHDICIGFAENYVTKNPNSPLLNPVIKLATRILGKESEIFTYSFPENKHWTKDQPRINASESSGVINDICSLGNQPYPHGSAGWCRYISNLTTPGGASGGPVIDHTGAVVAVNSKSMKIDGEYTSIAVPLRHILDIQLQLDLGPSKPERNGLFTVQQLITFGDIICDQ